MALFEIGPDRLEPFPSVPFAAQGLRERQDLQRVLRDRVEVISPGTLVLSEEFGDWEESRRRIDLLGLDREANLVVIELKRGDTGGHMELQAIRYAAMVSTMTFEQAVEARRRFVAGLGREEDSERALLEHLGWAEPDEGEFAQDVRIVLVAADFSKEVTTTALWLAQREVDVSCVRLVPYELDGRTLLDVQRILPLPEVGDYLERVREKARVERVQRRTGRDLTKYDVTVEGVLHRRLPKNRAIFLVVRHLCSQGVRPAEIAEAIPWRRSNLWCSLPGELDEDAFLAAGEARARAGGPAFAPRRWFCAEEELVRADGETHAFSTQWGRRTGEAMERLVERWPDAGLRVDVAE